MSLPALQRELIVLLEEPSAKAALEAVLPPLLGEITLQIIDFGSKQKLLKELPKRLKAYAAWLPVNSRILVLLDRDQDDCLELKQKLEEIARSAGLRSKSHHSDFQVINRIACEELEAWFLGDWTAVQQAFPKVKDWSQKAKFRNPDKIDGGTWEQLEKLLQSEGYFSGGLRKIELARTIAPHLRPERNSSSSFQAFCQAVRAVVNSLSP